MASKIADTIDNIQEYLEIKAESIKLRILIQLTKTFSGIISISVILLLGFFLLFFLSFAVAILLNDALNSEFLGYFILCGFYLLIIILVLILAQKGVIQGWFESIILTLTKKEDEKDDQTV